MVTGAAQGIGRALAEQLAAEGAILALVDKNEPRLRETVESLRKTHARVTAFPIDVRDSSALMEAVDQIEAEQGHIDYLFNNAGVGILAAAHDHSLEDWREVVDTNLYGVIHGIAAVYPRMIARRSGHIVNTGSMAGALPAPVNIAYVASKGGVVALTQALRFEAELHNVNVTLVTPMAVRTPMITEAKVIRIDRDAFFDAVRGPSISAEQCARTILEGVVKNRAVIRPSIAKLMWFLYRFLPFVIQMTFRRFARTAARLRTAE